MAQVPLEPSVTVGLRASGSLTQINSSGNVPRTRLRLFLERGENGLAVQTKDLR